MKSLSLLLLFTILSSTMGGKERSQACTPTDGYACCFAPGEVSLLSPKNKVFFVQNWLFQVFFSPYVFFSKVSFFFCQGEREQLRLRRGVPLQALLHRRHGISRLTIWWSNWDVLLPWLELSRNTSYMYIYMYHMYICNMPNNPPISILPVHLWHQILETHLCSIGRPTLSTGVGVFVCY